MVTAAPRSLATGLPAAGLLAFGLLAGGCVERTIHISSDPPGALLWLNDREVGRTPVSVEFLHYGTYDVRLVKDGYEPLLTIGDASPPWWDTVPLDFFAELSPGDPRSDIAWHYELIPVDLRREPLLERAAALRVETSEASDSPPTD